MTLRRVLLTLHRWVGLIAALFLVVLSLTGAALVFENEIDRALNPSLSYVQPRGEPLPLSALVARANAAQPDDPVAAIRIGERPDFSYELSARARRSILIDPYTGTMLGTRDREQSFARFVHLLHTRFVAGERGELAAGWGAVAMLGLALSGVVLWWPRRIFTIAGGASWKRTNFDLHNAVGFYASAVMVVVAASGVLIAFERTLDPVVLKLNGAEEMAPATLRSTPRPNAIRLAPERAAEIARTALPGAFVSTLNVPSTPTAIYRVLMKFPEDRTPAGRSRVYIDAFSGEVLGIENTRTAQVGRRIVNLKRSLHTGDEFGAASRALYFLASLAMALQVVTGTLAWWNGRRTPRRRASHRRPDGYRSACASVVVAADAIASK